eukprot:3451606-Rhodomonas_salina.3
MQCKVMRSGSGQQCGTEVRFETRKCGTEAREPTRKADVVLLPRHSYPGTPPRLSDTFTSVFTVQTYQNIRSHLLTAS